MPIYKELNLSPHSKTAIWKVEEHENFFSDQTGLISNKKKEVKRLEHLAGRFLLKYLLPQLEFNNIGISELGKPFMKDNSFHFSITHSFPYIGVAIDFEKEIGIDVQTIQERIHRIQYKFLSEQEQLITENKTDKITLAWAAKEAAFKRYGLGSVDFIQHMPITEMQFSEDFATLKMAFSKDAAVFDINLLGGIENDFAWSVTV
ncbi:4'-phosphopantetheinyl transferase superfamily protein [Taibaiella lutea]|uniref:4'-phosphopantetheinyl transferase superfamily protein n=1 Tax=Taibaiella lutea TaxID=2608001 RepID=A0A5M6CQ15_9BACT|nr:4'-phosphopantetheinyl transferase superfamily protein [Taibaiella lutea]KAA5537086.1 4'-phosphopantetheinyl transferase superfamily protein [Taibaiella lutea]